MISTRADLLPGVQDDLLDLAYSDDAPMALLVDAEGLIFCAPELTDTPPEVYSLRRGVRTDYRQVGLYRRTAIYVETSRGASV